MGECGRPKYISNANIRNMNLTQSVLGLSFWHQRINDICILQISELLERLHSLDDVGSRHVKGCKTLKAVYKGPIGAECVCYLQLSEV